MIPASNEMDWFEVSGDLSIAQSTIPLAELAQALKTTQNWIEIDDSVVLVPSSFKQLLKESTVSKKGIKVPVKAYSLLQTFMDDAIAQAENKGVPSLFSVGKIKYNLQSKSFKGKLRPYQEVGVNWLLYLHANGIGGVLGDEMGLGKTIQAICAICIISESSPNPILIISPKTLLFNWEKELNKFAPQVSFTTYHGQGRKIQSDSKVILSTYGTMANDIEEFVKIQFAFAIFDEAQVIKNAKTRNHKNCCLIQALQKLR
jgi:SNF2 family DNA or RNA helicase